MPKTSQILTSPLPGTTVAPVRDYTEEQRTQIKALREVCSFSLRVARTALTTLGPQYVATLQLPEDDPYHPWELKFLDRPDTIPRYMRAAKWYVSPMHKGLQRLQLNFPQET